MGINVSALASTIANTIARAGVVTSEYAPPIAEKTIELVLIAENTVELVTGADKLGFVQTELRAAAAALDPAFEGKFDVLWDHIKPLISIAVVIFRTVGLFVKLA